MGPIVEKFIISFITRPVGDCPEEGILVGNVTTPRETGSLIEAFIVVYYENTRASFTRLSDTKASI